MKKGHILHNPNAGNQEKSKKELLELMKMNGFDCGYSSTKKVGWKKMKNNTDFLVVAGGDGTIRQVALKLIEKKSDRQNLPIMLLPLGTANNVAKSLGIEGHVEEIMRNIDVDQIKPYDIGRVKGLKDEMIFLESFGFGIFPLLMKKMKDVPEREDSTPEENLKTALETLHGIVLNSVAQPYTIKVDGVTYTDNFLLVELMNTPSIGPNLNISPTSDPGDGELELILVTEAQREEFARYVSYKIGGIEKEFLARTVKVKRISIIGGPGPVHVDDELLEVKKPRKIRIQPEHGMMEFFVQ